MIVHELFIIEYIFVVHGKIPVLFWILGIHFRMVIQKN